MWWDTLDLYRIWGESQRGSNIYTGSGKRFPTKKMIAKQRRSKK